MPPGTADIIGNLKDAPVMNLFVLVGFLLVVLAASGKTVGLDTGGRFLSGGCGLGLLIAATAMFLGVVKARSAAPEDLTAAHGGKIGTPNAGTAPAPAPAPPLTGPAASPATSKAPAIAVTKFAPNLAMKTAAIPHLIQPLALPTPAAVLAAAVPKRPQTFPPKEVNGDWGCEETKTISASFVLPEGADFLSAVVDAVAVDKAKSFQRLPPSFNPTTRTVTGGVEFRGLDRVFFNCPGGGHGTVRLTVTAAVHTGAP